MKRARLAAAVALFSSVSLHASEIRVWQMTLRPRTAQEIALRYERSHPGTRVVVETLSWDDALQKLVLGVASHREPDVLELGSTWIPQFRGSRTLALLPESLGSGLLLSEPGRSARGMDAVPWMLGTRALFVNRSLLRAAGIDRPPLDTDELLRDCTRLRAVLNDIRCIGMAAADPYAPWQQLLSFAWSRDPHFPGETIEANDLSRPEIVAAARFYQSIRPYAMADLPRVLDGQFVSGRLPMVISGAWLPLLARDAAPELDYEVVPIPALPGGQSRGFAGGEYLAVSSRSANPALASSFIEYLLEPATLAFAISAQPGLLAARRAEELPPSSPALDPKIAAARRSLQSILETAVAPPSDPRWAASEQPLSSVVDHILLEGDSPEAAIQKAKRTLADALQRAGPRKGRTAEKVIGTINAFGLAVLLMVMLWPDRGWWSRLPVAAWWIVFIAIYLLPGLFVFVISSTSYDLLSNRLTFTGFENFIALAHSPEFGRSVMVTLIFVVTSVPLTLLAALSAAYAFLRLRRMRAFSELAAYLPALLPVVVTATVFSALFVGGGPMDWIMGRMGISVPRPAWLLNPWAAMSVVVLHAVWTSFGYYAVFFAVSLSSIPISVRDAAALDGAPAWLRFRSIEWPVLRPMVFLVVLLHGVRSVQVFPEIFIMTQGGPAGATTTVVYRLYELAFRTFDFGAASSIAVVLMLATLAAVLPFAGRSAENSS